MAEHRALHHQPMVKGERRKLRRQSTINRYNRFTLANFTINDFSLLRTFIQIRREAQSTSSAPSFTITSIKALESFLGYRTDYPGIEEDKIDDANQATQVP
jgi:hypothetical protein